MTIIRSIAPAFVLLLTLACSAPGNSASPSPSPLPSPSTQVNSAAQAAALVLASDARFARMQPLRTDMIGQSAWYDTVEDGDGFMVTINVGADDCMAGCIEHHSYAYHVDRDGTITLVSDEGDDITIPVATGTGDAITLHVSLASGPHCPVVTNPPDPNCAERPVVNASVTVFDPHGQQVASATSAEDGSVSLQLPAGAYFVVAQAMDGFMGQAAPQAFSAVGGDEVNLLFAYDTGIR